MNSDIFSLIVNVRNKLSITSQTLVCNNFYRATEHAFKKEHCMNADYIALIHIK